MPFECSNMDSWENSRLLQTWVAIPSSCNIHGFLKDFWPQCLPNHVNHALVDRGEYIEYKNTKSRLSLSGVLQRRIIFICNIYWWYSRYSWLPLVSICWWYKNISLCNVIAWLSIFSAEFVKRWEMLYDKFLKILFHKYKVMFFIRKRTFIELL